MITLQLAIKLDHASVIWLEQNSITVSKVHFLPRRGLKTDVSSGYPLGNRVLETSFFLICSDLEIWGLLIVFSHVVGQVCQPDRMSNYFIPDAFLQT